MRRYLLACPVLVGALTIGCGPKDGDDGDEAGSGNGETNIGESGETNVGESGESGESEGNHETGEESGESGGMPLTCEQAANEADCDEAYNPGEESECSWLPIHEVTTDRAGGCVVTATDRGVCAQRSGLDDGCNFPNLCEGDIEAYVQVTGTDTWDLATGPACRGVPGFEACDDDLEVPCSCACELP